MRNTGYWLIQILPFALLVALVTALAIDPPQLNTLKRTGFDVYQKLKPRRVPTEGPAVVVVEIDQESQRRIGPWPWPRTRLAQIFERLDALDARAAAALFDLSKPDPNAPQRLLLRLPPLPELEAIKARFSGWTTQDKTLARAIAKTPTVTGFRATAVAGAKLPGRKTSVDAPAGIADNLVRLEGAAGPIQLIEAAAAGNGAMPPALPPGQTTRKLPLAFLIGGRIYPSVLTELVRLTRKTRRISLKRPAHRSLLFGPKPALGELSIGNLKIPVDRQGWISLHVAPRLPARRISAWRLLADEVPAKRIKGRIVIVTLRTASTPRWLTPLGDTVTEPVLMAQALEQMLQGRFVSRPGFALDLEIAYVILVSLLLMFLLGRSRGYAALFMVMSAALMMPALGWAGFARYGWQIDGVMPALIIVVISLASFAAATARRQSNRESLMLRFQRNLPPRLLRQIVQSANRAPPSEEIRTVTAARVVIREFDDLVERHGAQEMTVLTRRLFSPATAILFSHGGTLDKLTGGRMELFWNAPARDDEHVLRACRTALEIMTSATRLNERLRTEGQEGNRPPEMDVTIGIETGECFVGDGGVAQRFEYTALGKPVAHAELLAAQSRFFGASVVLGPLAQAEVPMLATLELDLLRRPDRQPLPIFGLLGDEAIAEDPAFQRLKETHENMLMHYRARRWVEAQEALAQAREIAAGRLDALYDLYSGRIRAFRNAPPPDDWDGSTPGGVT